MTEKYETERDRSVLFNDTVKDRSMADELDVIMKH
jgi:hypothetical protein